MERENTASQEIARNPNNLIAIRSASAVSRIATGYKVDCQHPVAASLSTPTTVLKQAKVGHESPIGFARRKQLSGTQL